ncbi:MAG: hypothetical protein ACI39E_06690 [Acutalibacteraceae bacterium]
MFTESREGYGFPSMVESGSSGCAEWTFEGKPNTGNRSVGATGASPVIREARMMFRVRKESIRFLRMKPGGTAGVMALVPVMWGQELFYIRNSPILTQEICFTGDDFMGLTRWR